MAKAIARGNVSEAINKLQSNGGLHWASEKHEAMQHLITQWAEDLRLFPVSSSLIIARSNHDVRVLNEMARAVRLDMGQIIDQEFECETEYGSIFVCLFDS